MWPHASRRARLRLETLESKAVPAVFIVTNADDGGDSSLRWAITKANLTPGHDTIHFNIPGGGVQTIRPATPLPALTDRAGATIDGYTQPGSGENTLEIGDNAKLMIQLDGSQAGEADGLRLEAGTNKVRGMVINRFRQNGIVIAGGTGNVIAGNFIGTDPTGTEDLGNRVHGVLVESPAPNNRIGGTAPGERNLLSGNGDPADRAGSGVTLNSPGNLVQGNYLGTSASGVAPLGNTGNVNAGAINIAAPGNRIGGTAPGAGNVIAGNTGGCGIFTYNPTRGYADPPATLIQGNFIGVGADGLTVPGPQVYGIYLAYDSINFTIGGTTAAARNIISGNGRDIVLDGVSTFWRGASNTTIQGNYIGTDVTGQFPVAPAASTEIGIYDYGTTGLRVGGPTDAPGTGAGNVIANHIGSGILTGGRNAKIQGNVFGLKADGSAVLGAQTIGIELQGPDNVVGGPLATQRNVISGHGQRGILIDQPSATRNLVAGNYIGTNREGTVAIPNVLGVELYRGANGNRIEGRNLISGNTAGGVRITGAGTDNNVVAGNYIGTDAVGSGVIPNAGPGVHVTDGASQNLVGGFTASARNVISGNTAGVRVDGPVTFSNRVSGNYIGTTASGVGRPSGGSSNDVGVLVTDLAPATVVGGAEPGAGNVISGNARGVVLSNAQLAAVHGNRIGTDATGRRAIGNDTGVLLDQGSSLNEIGGTGPGQRNLIAGNGVGIELSNAGAGPMSNRILGNWLGVSTVGGVLPNDTGIRLGGTDVTLPGTDIARNEIRGNRVENSRGNGIELLSPRAVDNTIRGNTLRRNGRSGIALRSGASRNRVGGPGVGDANVIAGNAVFGVEIATPTGAPVGPGVDNVVEGNLIGTRASGIGAEANGIGVLVAGGKRTLIRGNLISGNTNAGVSILEPASTGNRVQANQIGVDRRGRRLGNGGAGVAISVDASDNVVGGGREDSDPALGNEIAFNGGGGVIVGDLPAGLGAASVGNTIRFNSIHDNVGLGIDLGNNGPTPNSDPPSDVGPNRLQNAPELLVFRVGAGRSQIAGTVRGRPGETLIVDVYASPTADPSGRGEGQFYLGTAIAGLDETGFGTFAMDPLLLPRGWVVTATATRKDTRDTSEFSTAVAIR